MIENSNDSYLVEAIDSLKRKILVVSSDFTILAVNKFNEQYLKKELVGQTCYKILKNSPTPCRNCPVPEVIFTQQPIIRNTQTGIDDAEAMTCVYSYPLKNNTDKNAIVVLDFDLASINIIDRDRQSSNAFFRNLIHSAPDAVIAADRTGKVLIFNETASQLSGYTVHEALSGLNIKTLYPNGMAYTLMKLLRSDKHGDKGKLKEYKLDARHKNGDIFPISLSASIVHDGEQEVATIGFFRDLRNTIKMKEELKKTQIQLLQAEKMASLGKLAAGVAHQLNNPLGGITLYSQIMLEEYELSEDAVSDLKRILRDAQRCSRIVKELLEFARQTNYKMRPQNINEAISRTLFLLKNQAIFHNIVIEYSPLANLPEINGDIQQLNHLFMNIILNAADAMSGKGKLTITTKIDDNSNKIKITVNDTGAGIPEDVLPNIFEPFFTTKDEGKGTGLGLSMAYGIVEQHNGVIFADSIIGKGTTFTILLPPGIASNATVSNGTAFDDTASDL